MRYRVVETVQFSDLWQSAIDSGVIDPVAESKLQGLARLLSLNPYYFPLFDTNGEPAGLRWVDFIPGSIVRIEIWDSVVEDDQTVYLETVEVI
jgi:hypothetical protein